MGLLATIAQCVHAFLSMSLHMCACVVCVLVCVHAQVHVYGECVCVAYKWERSAGLWRIIL